MSNINSSTRSMFGHKYIMPTDLLYGPPHLTLFSIPLHSILYPVSLLYIYDNFSPPIPFSIDPMYLKYNDKTFNNKRSTNGNDLKFNPLLSFWLLNDFFLDLLSLGAVIFLYVSYPLTLSWSLFLSLLL